MSTKGFNIIYLMYFLGHTGVSTATLDDLRKALISCGLIKLL